MSLFAELFTKDVLGHLHEKTLAPGSSDDVKALDQVLNGEHRDQQSWRIHFSAWLDFCRDAGGLNEDRKNRLTKLDSWHAWQQTLNELRVPYFLHRVYGMGISYIQAGGADVKASTANGPLEVEIKTPGEEPPFLNDTNCGFLGKDKKSITQNLQQAQKKQFKKGEQNLLVIAGHCLQTNPVSNDTDLQEALYGHEVLRFSIDTQTGKGVGEPTIGFVRDGKLQHNRFTRIGAVLAFQDGRPFRRWECPSGHQYQCCIYHNPYAEVPVSSELFRGTKQLIFDNQGRSLWKWENATNFTFRGY